MPTRLKAGAPARFHTTHSWLWVPAFAGMTVPLSAEHLLRGAQLRDPGIPVLEPARRDPRADLIESFVIRRALACALPDDRGIAIRQQHQAGRARGNVMRAGLAEAVSRIMQPAEREVEGADQPGAGPFPDRS